MKLHDQDVGANVHIVVIVFHIGFHQIHTLPDQRHDDVEPLEADVFELEQLFEELNLELFVYLLQAVVDRAQRLGSLTSCGRGSF